MKTQKDMSKAKGSVSDHKPTPWVLRDTSHESHTEITKDGDPIGVVFNGLFGDGSSGEANAAFIVRAVNAHDLLLSALHSVINSCPARKEYDDIVAIAEKAIAKAEGK